MSEKAEQNPGGAHPEDGPRLTPVDFDPFAAVAAAAAAPLSEAQQEIWAVVQMGPEASCAYNQCFGLRLVGQVSVDALKRAVQHFFDRHEALRMTFDPSGESQVVQPPGPVDVPLLDLTELSRSEREDRIDSIFTEELTTPFNLEDGPPARVQIVVEAPDRCVLIFTAHHILCDGWAASILFRELPVLYGAAREGQPPALPAAGSFCEFVRTETGADGRARADAAMKYWQDRFSGVVPTLDLPLDRPRPRIQAYRGGEEALQLDAAESASIRQMAAQQGATIVGFFLAAFQALLYRLTGQTDIVVGVPVSVRPPGDPHPLVGHATNFLPIRVQIDGEASFATHLRVVKKTLLDAQDHQAITFGALVRELKLPRDPSRTPLVTAVFNVARGSSRFEFPDAEGEMLTPPRALVNFELDFNVEDTIREFAVQCSYTAELFESATMRRWLSHYRTLLRAIVSDPETAVDRLPLLDEAERQRVLTEWSGAAAERDEAPRRLVHEVFEEHASEHPEAPAVIWEDGSLTCGELNKRANRLARLLREKGVLPEVRVGVCLPRSPELIVALLGVLKAGGVYVPLDPTNPSDRVAALLDDAGASIVVTSSTVVKSTETSAATTLLMDDLPGGAPEGADANPDRVARSENLAYVIYTSGSTGRPKGVMVEHRSLAFYVETAARELELSSGDRMLQFNAISFDVSQEEIWLPLTRGATLVLRSDAMARSAEEFVERCGDWGITVLDLPTVFWHELVSGLASGAISLPSSIRLVFLGGERALPEKVAQWSEAVPRGVRLVNGYGPTETTITATWCDLVRDGQPVEGAPIGRPIPGSRAYVLDPRGNLVPAGVTGELYLGGAGLARGYLGRPEGTAGAFVPNPFAEEPGARFYRTGDLVRFLPDGSIEFLNRSDYQLKIRGFRVELGEVETALRAFPGMREVVVVAHETPAGDRRLAAYLIHGPTGPANVTELRAHLKKRVPDYMVPSSFVFLERLPLTTNGKVDRKALARIGGGAQADRKAHVGPRTEMESLIANLWKDALGVAQVSVRDNFFDLGGHSLLALRVLAAIEKETGRHLPPREFPFMTLEQLAAGLQTEPVVEEPTSTRSWTGRLRNALGRLGSGGRDS